MRPKRIGELAEYAIDLLALFGLELANAVSELDGRRRLDEQRGASGRRAVNDAADTAAALTSHRDHIPAVAHGDRHVRDAMVWVEPLDRTLEKPNEVTFGGAQFAPNAAQRGRGVIFDGAVIVNRPLDAVLERLGAEQTLRQWRQHCPRDSRAPLIAQRVTGSSRRPK